MRPLPRPRVRLPTEVGELSKSERGGAIGGALGGKLRGSCALYNKERAHAREDAVGSALLGLALLDDEVEAEGLGDAL